MATIYLFTVNLKPMDKAEYDKSIIAIANILHAMPDSFRLAANNVLQAFMGNDFLDCFIKDGTIDKSKITGLPECKDQETVFNILKCLSGYPADKSKRILDLAKDRIEVNAFVEIKGL